MRSITSFSDGGAPPRVGDRLGRRVDAVVEVVEDQVAVNERHAAELSGFSVRRLRAWDARELVGPSIKR
jgi:hypothetical protein